MTEQEVTACFLVLAGAPKAPRKPATPKGTPAKKVKKRNPWSEDESKSDSDIEDVEPVVIPRDTKSQRASGTLRHATPRAYTTHNSSQSAGASLNYSTLLNPSLLQRLGVTITFKPILGFLSLTARLALARWGWILQHDASPVQ